MFTFSVEQPTIQVAASSSFAQCAGSLLEQLRPAAVATFGRLFGSLPQHPSAHFERPISDCTYPVPNDAQSQERSANDDERSQWGATAIPPEDVGGKGEDGDCY